MNCEVCGEDVDTHPTIDVRNRSQLLVCQDRIVIPCGDRHPKWQRVEPGTVIPAGQPYRFENGEGFAFENLGSGLRSGSDGEWFVDSSWKPPLVLPTEPTWGIAVLRRSRGGVKYRYVSNVRRSGDFFGGYHLEDVLDFIPLTDEQVARIEAAR